MPCFLAASSVYAVGKHRCFHGAGVADVGLDKSVVFSIAFGNALQVVQVAGVGELIEH
jgi:hypothetical protein